jgi:hypothetical protein
LHGIRRACLEHEILAPIAKIYLERFHVEDLSIRVSALTNARCLEPIENTEETVL